MLVQWAYMGDGNDVTLPIQADIRHACSEFIGGRNTQLVREALHSMPADYWHCEIHVRVDILSALRDRVMWASGLRSMTLYDPTKVPASHARIVTEGTNRIAGLATKVDSVVLSAFTLLKQSHAMPPLLLSAGCYQGLPSQRSVVPTLRLHDHTCAALSQPVASEYPKQWLSSFVMARVGQELMHQLPLAGCMSSLTSDVVLSTLLQQEEQAAPTYPVFNSSRLAVDAVTHVEHTRRLQDGRLVGLGVNASQAAPSGVAHEQLAPWSIGSAPQTLATLPSASFSAITLHWTLFASSDAAGIIKQCARVLQRGGVLRVTEPDYRSYQTPSRRVQTSLNRLGTQTSPGTVQALMVEAGLVHVSAVALDETHIEDVQFAEVVASECVDEADIQLASQ